MKAPFQRTSSRRFGQFEFDPAEEKLLKRGLAVRLENQPFQILAALLEHPGEVVTREQLCSGLWPNGTYVDFDESLNTAVRKLRIALSDSPENPIFIETVPRRGYRFIAPVQISLSEADPGEQPETPPAPPVPLQHLPIPPSPQKFRRNSGWLIALALVFVGACWAGYRRAFPPPPRVTQITRLTNSGHVDPWGAIASDGSRLFFLERDGDHWNNRQISAAGGRECAL